MAKDLKYPYEIRVRLTEGEQTQLDKQATQIRASWPGLHVTMGEVIRMNLLKGMNRGSNGDDD